MVVWRSRAGTRNESSSSIAEPYLAPYESFVSADTAGSPTVSYGPTYVVTGSED
jgi:hypothetical protein